MRSNLLRSAVSGVLLGGLAACGGGGGYSSGTGTNPAPQSVSVPMVISDDSTQDWATIGVKILSIALVPQGGGSNVVVYTAPNPVPVTNLVDLDQIGDLLATAAIPPGTYTGAVLSVGANPGDVQLVASADPEVGFAAAPGATIPSDQIQIQHSIGASPNMTVPVKVNFTSPVTFASGQTALPLDIEFDLAHPAFIVGHTPPATNGNAPMTIWAVNFDGPVRHHPIRDIAALVLRHMYGNVTQVAQDNSSITINRDFATLPVVNPEMPVSSGVTVQILADSTNGTLYFDLDNPANDATIKDFSNQAMTIAGKYVRVAARYQENGTLVAVRVFVSSSFNTVWLSPEGHVLHVNPATDILVVENESGVGVQVAVDANTNFYFRTPENALADATPIGTGPGFLANQNLVRGFKVHVNSSDPLQTPMVAQSIDIETAAYGGAISNADQTGFLYTARFRTRTDDYAFNAKYISSSTPNGKDANKNTILGFMWWNFTYPTLADTGTNAVADFEQTVDTGTNFGGLVGLIPAYGVSGNTWGDAANPQGWAARYSVLLASPLPLGRVASPFDAGSDSFTLTVLGGTLTPTVDISTATGSATLVYQVDRTGDVVTVSRIDVTTPEGITALTDGLVAGAPVKVFGVPTVSGAMRAYVVAYYTGDSPAS
jgi:hypothetical protein